MYFKNERKIQLFKKHFIEIYKNKMKNHEMFSLVDVNNEILKKHMNSIANKIELEILEKRIKFGKGRLKMAELREGDFESEIW